jgi:hypothetical protein
MDFSNAQLPELTPLKNSVAQGNFEIENELRNLFIELFDEVLAETLFDINVLGMPWLGSLNLIRKVINADGLVLLPSLPLEEPITRYIYKLWKSSGNQGRGLHFLRHYLTVHFGSGGFELIQLSQLKSGVYPLDLIPSSTANENYFLTSRVRISIDSTKTTWNDLKKITPILRAVIPARIVPEFEIITIPDPCHTYYAITAVSDCETTVYPEINNEPIPPAHTYYAITAVSDCETTVYPN